MKKFIQKKCNKQKGFTLVETLVAVSIFTLSVISLMAILSNGIIDTTYAKQKITAEYLAQEGIEYIRNMRDTYVLYYSPTNPTTGWNNFILKLTNASCNDPAKGCYFDDQSLNFSNNSMPITIIPMISCNPNCPNLRYVSSGVDAGRYNYNILGSSDSGFSRKIKLEYVAGSNEAKIISQVSWKQQSGTYNIFLSENLFNWTQ